MRGESKKRSDWLIKAEAGQTPPRRKDVEEIIAAVNDLVSKGSGQRLSDDLSSLDVGKMPVASMVAIFRTAAILAADIPGWHAFEESLRTELDRRGRGDITLGIGAEAVDHYRVILFEDLAKRLNNPPSDLSSEVSEAISAKWSGLNRKAAINEAFAEAWLSNLLEGIRFPASRAESILLRGDIPEGREDDAQDLIGTYNEALANKQISTTTNYEMFERDLCRIHARVMQSRKDKLPGRFRTFNVSVGNYEFVAPNAVRQTLKAGFDMLQTIPAPFSRAVFLAFFVSEVHPFMDGNGRTSRLVMNAELERHSLPRIVLPQNLWAGYRNGLRDISLQRNEGCLVTILQVALVWSASVPWGRRKDALRSIFEAQSAMRGAQEMDNWISKYMA